MQSLGGRRRAIWVVVGVAGLAIVFGLNATQPGSWRLLGIPPGGSPPIPARWPDTVGIVRGALCRSRGFDPLQPNDCNAYGIAVNYPRLWFVIADAVGRSAAALVAVLTTSFVIALTSVFSRLRLSLVSVGLYALALLGPPTVLAFERGNNELSVVALVVLAAWLWAQNHAWAYAAASLALVAATALKVYPIVALLVLLVLSGLPMLEQRRLIATSRFASVGCGLVIASAVLALQWDDLRTISRVAPAPATYAYGIRTYRLFMAEHGYAGHGSPAWPIALFLAGLVVAVPVLRRKQWPRVTSEAVHMMQRRPEDLCALLGLALFAATLPLTNWPYRLILLSLVIPAGARRVQEGTHTVAAVTLLLSIVSLWHAVVVQITISGPALFAAANATLLLCGVVLVSGAAVCVLAALE